MAPNKTQKSKPARTASGDGGAAGADEADREVDLAQNQGERFGHGEHHDHGALLEQVHEVARRQIHVVRADDLEHQDDGGHRDDDRKDPALAGPDAGHVAPDVLAQGLRDHLRRQLRDGGLRRRGGQVRGDVAGDLSSL